MRLLLWLQRPHCIALLPRAPSAYVLLVVRWPAFAAGLFPHLHHRPEPHNRKCRHQPTSHARMHTATAIPMHTDCFARADR